MVSRVIEGTFVIVIVGLVLANASSFSQAARAIGDVYTGAVRALSGVANGGR